MRHLRRVLLVNSVPLFSSGRASFPERIRPGLLSIHTFLTAHGVPVELLDLHIEIGAPRGIDDVSRVSAECVSSVLNRDFDLLAISCSSSFHYLGALDLAEAVRRADPGAYIVVGGVHPTVAPEDFCADGSPFDVVVRGEGELELLDLAGSRDGRPTRTEVRHGRPLPLDQAWVDFVGYPYWRSNTHRILFPLSRGCPHSCVFCAGARCSPWRAYPPKVARGIVETMVSTGADSITLSDPTFGQQPAWRRAFLQELRGLRPPAVVSWETRVDAVSLESVTELRGLDVHLNLGVETGSSRMVEVMNKARHGPTYLRTARRLLTVLGRQQVPTNVFLLLNHPGEDAVSLAQTMDLARELADRSAELSAYPKAQDYMHLPGTEIANNLSVWEERTGARFGHPGWWRERGEHDAFATDVRTAVDPSDVQKALREAQALRGRAVMGMPVAARLTWRRHRAPIRLPESTVAILQSQRTSRSQPFG